MVASLVALAAATASARGQGLTPERKEKEADALIMRGLEMRRGAPPRDAEALALFRRAHEVAPSARTHGQIGLALLALKRWKEAEEHLVAALESAPDSRWLQEHRQLLKDELEQVKPKVGSLVLIGTVGATVSVNDQVVGTLPLSRAVRVDAGVVKVRARAPGHDDFVREVSVEGGGGASVEIALVPSVHGVSPRAADSDRRELILPPVSGSDEKTSSAQRWSWPRRISAAIFLAGAAAAVAGGVMLLWPNQSCPPQAPGQMCTVAPRDRTAGGILLGSGATAMVAGGIGFWVFDRKVEVAVSGSVVALSVGGGL